MSNPDDLATKVAVDAIIKQIEKFQSRQRELSLKEGLLKGLPEDSEDEVVLEERRRLGIEIAKQKALNLNFLKQIDILQNQLKKITGLI